MTCKTTFTAALCLCWLSILAAPAQPADNPDWFGTWWRGGPNASEMTQRYPFIKGVFVSFRWSELEPEPEQYDWAMFDGTMQRYADARLYIQFIVLVGPHSPRWLYDHGVPEVKTTPTLNPHGRPHGWTYPFYLDEDYQRYYWRVTRAVAEHVDSLPAAVRNCIICLQTAEGTTGDEGGYKGRPLDPQYTLPEDQWRAFKFKTWLLFNRLYTSKTPRIHLLINSGNSGEYHDWIMEHMPDTWRKAGNPGHGYQLNGETRMIAFLDPIINHPNRNGAYIRCRSEMDETFKGWFAEAPVWNQYWLNLWGLHFGIDFLQHQTGAFEDPRHAEGFRFYTTYGGRKDPAQSPGVWCALRDGLDAADYDRFPADAYGAGQFNPRAQDQREGIRRCLNIAAAFADRGARQEDPDKAMRMTMQNRSAAAMNDVGWEIWTGNYERYLTQYDPNGTSLGYWRIGPEDQPYGRFARGFDTATGRNTMYFNVDDRFWHGGSGARPGGLAIRVVYFDQGTGEWTLKYDARDESQKTAATVQKTNSGRWKEITADVPDAWFGNRCPNGTDIMLVNSGNENTLFHMVEVTKKQQD